MRNLEILFRNVDESYRVVFVHPHTKQWERACQALGFRDRLEFGPNPIPVQGFTYNAWYADFDGISGEAGKENFAAYAMIVRDFYASDLRNKFQQIFKGFDPEKVPRSVHNPDNYMRAQRRQVQGLLDKYKNTTSPLEFYGSIHMAEGVALLLDSLKYKDKKGVIINDAQGMAKTRQVAVAAREAGFKTMLTVAPKTARVTTWPDEIAIIDPKWPVHLIDHKHWRHREGWNVLQWDELRRMPDEFFNHLDEYELLVPDEYHKASNLGSQRSQKLERIAKKIPWMWAMSGTAVRKRPRNIINPLRLMGHPIVSTDEKIENFLMRYCAKWDEAKGEYNFDHAQNLEELHEQLRDVLIRREKDQTNLPPKVRHVKKIPLSENEIQNYKARWEAYKTDPKKAVKMARMHISGRGVGGVKRKINQMSAAMVKIPHVIAWAEDLIEQGEKVVLFTDVTDVWVALMTYFGDQAVGINGSVSDQKRVDAKKKFQTDPNTMVFVGNIIAAGESITLTAASHLGFVDITRVPTEQLQAEDRIHRGGATKTCIIMYFLAQGTEDFFIFKDFLKSKAVVEEIIKRRRPDGSLPPDSVWYGDLDGLLPNNKLVLAA